MSAVPPLPKVRNPHTHAVIRRETFWQITAPFAVVVLMAAGLMALIILGAAGVVPSPTSALADVSLMFLILIAATLGLFAFVLTAGLAYGLSYLVRETPFWLKRLQDFLWAVAMQTKSMTQRVDNRIVGVHLSLAAVKSIGEHFRALFAPWREK